MSSRTPIRCLVPAIVVAAIVLLLPAIISAQGTASETLARAHALHAELVRKPMSARQPAEYQQLAQLFESVWNQDHGAVIGQEAEYEAGSVYVSLARDLQVRPAWVQARDCFLTLLRKAPLSVYRRNTEWAVAQVEINHLQERAAGDYWLRDFLHRYPADPRAEIAHEELRGQRVPRAPILSNHVNGPHPLPLAPVVDRKREPARVKTVVEHPVQKRERRRVPRLSPARARGRVREVVFGRAGAARPGRLNQILGLRVRTEKGETRVVLGLTRPVRVVRGYLPSSHRYYYDLHSSEMGSLVSSGTVQKMTVDDHRVLQVHVGQNRQGVVRIVIDAAGADVRVRDDRILSSPPRFEVILMNGAGRKARPEPLVGPVHGLDLARREAGPARPQNPRRVDSRSSTRRASRRPEDQGPTVAILHVAPPRPQPAPPSRNLRALASVAAVVSHPAADARSALAASTLSPTAAADEVAANHLPHTLRPPPPRPSVAPPTLAEANPLHSELTVTHGLYTDRGDPPTRAGDRSLTRVLGLKIHKIVIDPGHGGHDTGTIGPDGLYEKTVVLDVALRLGHLLRDRLGMDVIYTRKTDKFIPLQERTEIANRAHADLFLSIHANSSTDPHVRGIETYYLNFTHNPHALAVAARENATSELSIHSEQMLIQKIALHAKQQESREFAGDLLTSLVHATGEEDRGVKSAPFVVLIGAQMPSVLAEISFLSDSRDAHLLRQGWYRERLAEALYRGVKHYVESLNGLQPIAPRPTEHMVENSGPLRQARVRRVADRKP